MEFIYFVILSFQLAIGIWTIRKSIIKQIQVTEMFRPERVVKGNELIFISRIHKQGYGIEVVSNHKMQDLYGKDDFQINCLSISKGTYIASGMSTFVVKLKSKE